MELIKLPIFACTTCDPLLRDAILDEQFGYRLATIGLPLLAGGLLTWYVVQALVARSERANAAKLAPVAGAGTLVGLGVGGFIDGIVLHQILQVHQMISNQLPPTTLLAKGVNMFWDGIFHVAALVLTAAGIGMMWRLARRREQVLLSGSAFLFAALLGWGAFNVLDSIANHFIFRYHDVVEAAGNPMMWNMGFLVLGVAQIAIGWVGIRRARRGAAPPAGH